MQQQVLLGYALEMPYQECNVVFEPTDDRGVDWVNYSLKKNKTAFKWNKPAIISSHRVNFCGHIDPKNRKKGLTSLKKLLQYFTQKWPDVEFESAPETIDILTQKLNTDL